MSKPNPSTWFKHLYQLRWGVEEGYKRENREISDLSAHAAKQDFYANLFVLNLTAVLS